jgi:hypothetical protein
MLKTIQIIKYMLANGFSKARILEEFCEIVDNGQSELFELSENDIVRITRVFESDDKFNSAWVSAQALN